MHLNFLSWLFLFLIANFLKMVHFFNFHFCCLSIIFNLKINMHKHLCSVQFSHSVMSGSLQPHGPQHARLPYPSPTPGAHPNPCPWSRWCHPTISSSVVPFSSCPQSFPASGSFPKTFVWRVLNLSCVLQQLVKMHPSMCSATTAKFNNSWSTFSTICPSSAPKELPFDFSLSTSSCPLIKLPTNYSYLFGFALATFFCASTDAFAISRCSLVFSEIVCFHGVLLLFILKNIL